MEQKYIFRTKVETEYTVIRNELITDKILSLEARGMLVYLLSKPETWIVTKGNLIDASPAGGKKVSSILKELETAGYIKRNKFRNKKGQWEWHTWVYDKPQPLPLPPTILPKRGDGETILPKTTPGLPIDGLGVDIVSTELKKTDPQNNELKKIYIQKIGKLTPSKIRGFQKWEDAYSEKWILEAMDLAVQYNKKSFGYIQAILENWEKNGRSGAKPSPENVDYLEDKYSEFIDD